MGEWFEGRDSTTGLFDPYPPEVELLLRTYYKPISVVFIAPRMPQSARAARGETQQSLIKAMQTYDNSRKDKSKDNLLFLYSKWDEHSPPGQGENVFATAPASILGRTIEREWSGAWGAFTGISDTPNRFVMPYSAGRIENNMIVDAGPHQPTFDRFNRVLWNWLYANAVPEADGKRPVLLPDAAPASPVQLGVFQRLANWFLPSL